MREPTVDLSRPRAFEALLNDDAMRCWSKLRMLGAPTPSAELAKACGMKFESVVESLDLLESGGLVRKLPAAGRRRTVAFEITVPALVVVLSDDPSGRRRFEQMIEKNVARADQILARRKPLAERGAGEWYFRQVSEVVGTREELDELRRRIYAASEYAHELEERALRMKDLPPEWKHHAIQLHADPVAPTATPLPNVYVMMEKAAVQQRVGRRESPAVLSARELEIARLLQGGLSRADAAGRLGISAQTVSTFCKRIFKKLGITRAIELNQFAFEIPSAAKAPRTRRR
jgi:DNA-binding CsgD family transcriptional regulator/DNA-binding Lrp family transcriptional regulator